MRVSGSSGWEATSLGSSPVLYTCGYSRDHESDFVENLQRRTVVQPLNPDRVLYTGATIVSAMFVAGPLWPHC